MCVCSAEEIKQAGTLTKTRYIYFGLKMLQKSVEKGSKCKVHCELKELIYQIKSQLNTHRQFGVSVTFDQQTQHGSVVLLLSSSMSSRHSFKGAEVVVFKVRTKAN